MVINLMTKRKATNEAPTGRTIVNLIHLRGIMHEKFSGIRSKVCFYVHCYFLIHGLFLNFKLEGRWLFITF